MLNEKGEAHGDGVFESSKGVYYGTFYENKAQGYCK